MSRRNHGIEPVDHQPENGSPLDSEMAEAEPFPLQHSILIGPSGLRAGWRLAIYFASFYFLTYATSFIIAPLLMRLPDNRLQTPYLLLIEDCIGLFAATLPAVFLGRLEQRPFSAYGLPPVRAFGKNFWIGTVWGLASLTLLLGAMRALGVFYFGGIAVHGVRLLKFAAFWGLLFLVVALYEEFLSRGYTQFTLAEGIGFWPAALLISMVFGGSHLSNPGESWAGAAGAGLIGLFWCFTLRRTGSLWFGIGMHAAWDWGESFLYAVPDSGIVVPGHLFKSSFHGPDWLTGGPVGPEGSVLLIILVAGLWAVFNWMYPEVKYVVHK